MGAGGIIKPRGHVCTGEHRLDIEEDASVTLTCTCSTLPEGGTLFTFGLSEARLGRTGGDNSIPEAAMSELKVGVEGAGLSPRCGGFRLRAEFKGIHIHI